MSEMARAAGERPIMVIYDQVYWMLTFGETRHVTPVGLRPEMARYTIFVDAISKSFAATGLRVGWGVIPEPLSVPFRALMGHMGAENYTPEYMQTIAGRLPFEQSVHRPFDAFPCKFLLPPRTAGSAHEEP